MVDHDHGPVRQVTDSLMLILAGSNEGEMDLLSHHHSWLQRICQVVDIQHGSVLEACNLGEIFVGRDESGTEDTSGLDQPGVEAVTVFGLSRVVDGDAEFGVALHLFEAVEASLAALTLADRGGVGHDLQFVEDKARDDESPGEEARAMDPRDTAVHDDIGIEEEGLAGSGILAKANVGNDEGEIVLSTAEGEGSADESEAGEEGHADGELDGVCGVGFRDLEDFDQEAVDVHFCQQPGTEQPDEQTEGGVGEAPHGDSFAEPFDEDEEGGEDESTENTSPEGEFAVGALGAQGDGNAGNFANQKVNDAGDIDRGAGGEFLHKFLLESPETPAGAR